MRTKSMNPSTKLTLNILHCTGLPRLPLAHLTSSARERDAAQLAFEDAELELTNAYNSAAIASRDELAQTRRAVDRATREYNRTRHRLEELTGTSASLDDGRSAFDSGRAPNPFVVLAIDEYGPDSHPVLHTKAVRGNAAPIWKHDFVDFPLGAHLAYKRELDVYRASGDNDETSNIMIMGRRKSMRKSALMHYMPRHLVLLIYHDDAKSDGVHDSEITRDDEQWLRDTPRRSRLLARAEWPLEDLRENFGREIERELNVIDAQTGRKIQGASLSVRACLHVDPSPFSRVLDRLTCVRTRMKRRTPWKPRDATDMPTVDAM